MTPDRPARLSELTSSHLANHRSLDFVRVLSLLLDQNFRMNSVAKEFPRRFPRSLPEHHALVERAAVAPGLTSDAAWSTLAALKPLADGFVSFERAQTIVGKLTTLRRVPFNSAVPVQTAAPLFGWAGENKLKPIGKLSLSTVNVPIAKSAGIVIVTDELAKLQTPGSDVSLRDALISGIAHFLNQQFCDPAVAGVANVAPASITNGITPIAPSGSTAAALVADVAELCATFLAANPDVPDPTLLMTPAAACILAGATNCQTLTAQGGVYAGFAVVTAAGVGLRVIAVDPAGILLADDGESRIDATNQTTIDMNDAPTDPPTAASVPVSLWQMNLTAFRVERVIHWMRARTAAVSWLGPITLPVGAAAGTH